MDRRTLYVDIDDTLLIHDKSAYPVSKHVTVLCNGREFVGVPHVNNINMLIKFYRLGYEVNLWSRTGESWARAVAETLGIENFVTHFLTKPDFIIDDKDTDYWMGPNVYRQP